MRVTSFTIFNQVTRALQQRLRDMSVYSDRLTSGLKINKPSDDVSGISNVLDYRINLNEIEQYKKNVDDVLSHLEYTDTIMNSVYNQISAAKERAVQASNGSLTPEDRASVAVEVENIRDEVIRLSQSTFRGRYIFSGHKTDTMPFDASFVYQGNSGEINVLIDRNSTLAVNIPGDEAFSVSGTTFMETLDDLTYALENNIVDQDDPPGPAGIRQALTSLEEIIDQISNVRANVGARMKRLEEQKISLDDRSLAVNTLLSNTQDTDIAETVSELTKIQFALESLRASGSKVISQSLLDFLK